MICAGCGKTCREGARFCSGCGAALAARCPACGAETESGARFCDGCGTALVAQPPKAPDKVDARKIVSILFADLAGSTALHERLDPESARRVMERYYTAARTAVEAHGGTVVKLLGDGVMAAFGVPRVAEDDAVRAVYAAVAITEAVRELGFTTDLSVRVAVNTGEVVVSAGDSDVVGDPVNVAARLQQEAGNGEVVVGEATERLVATRVTLAPLGTVALKGRAEQTKAYRVVSLERPAGAAATPFVGRDQELARVRAVYDAAVGRPAAHLVVLLGSPGLGKSRLIDEVGRRLGDAATVVTAHCDAAGGATFAPLADALREHLGIEAGAAGETMRQAIEAVLPADDAERIAGGVASLLAGSPASPEETFFVVRRLLTALAGARPVVLVIDDLHWAEPLLLDLVEHLVQWGGGVPLLVLVGARPELREVRSSLVTPGGFVADVVTLGGLDAGAATRLAANVIGAADLPAAVAAKVLATSEGNPLFVGELVRMLVQEGALAKEGERWIVGANLAALEMPPTIQALLAARIERLRPEERGVLECAAVVGRHFSRSAVAALLSSNGRDLDARLEALRRTELIERDTGWFLGEPVLRFHHVLIRDAAYRRLLKGTRAELHERLAEWIEARAGDTAEHDETIGWHFEQAHQHLRELGPLDAAAKTLGERAARRLAAAGRRALARDDVPLAASLLGRAIDRLDENDPSRADLALDWCEALLSAGDVAQASTAITELARWSADVPRLRAWHTCFTGQLTVLTAPEALQSTADAVASAADDLAKLDDDAGEAKAHSVHAQALARLGRVGACEAALDKALAAARKAGDRRRANAVLAGAPVAALWGPSPVTRASGRCLDVVRVLRITQGAPAVEAVALSCQGVLEALRGRTDAARRMIASSRKMVEELGIAHRLFEADVFAGRIDLIEGDAAAAARALGGAYEGLRELGLGIDAARAGAMLARAQLALGDVAEAERLSHESEALAGDDLQAAIAWRGVRAEALARRGESTAAVELARAAVDIAAATDALLDHADARLALAAALRAAGRAADGDSEERRAIELWEAKGAVLLAQRARRDGRAPSSSPAPPRAAMAIRRQLRETTIAATFAGGDDAFGRFEEGAPPPPRRRVRPNAATAAVAAGDAAINRGDSDAIRSLFCEAYEEVDHPTGSTYGLAGALASVQRFRRSRDASYRVEPLAALGDRLTLGRRRIRATGTGHERFDVGEYENETINLVEVDERGLYRRLEVFAANRLGDALVRLYERHAELLPDGAARARAAAVASSVAAWNGPVDLAYLARVYDPAAQIADHRFLGTWSSRDAAEILGHFRLQLDLAPDFAARYEDVLAVEPDAVVVRFTFFGTARDSGGPFENHICVCFTFGADGRITGNDIYEAEQEGEALARFHELATAPAAARPVSRRVRANAATRCYQRLGKAIDDRDLDTWSDVLSGQMEFVHHPTRTTFGRKGTLATWRSLLRAERLTCRSEVLATLGDALALGRQVVSGEGFTEEHLRPVGAVEVEEILLMEVGEHGQVERFEVFAPDRLGDAVTRLYERYAALLPEGAARHRAAATARSFAVWSGPIDPDRLAAAIAPSQEAVDHRHLGTWSSRGAEAALAHWRWQVDLVADFTGRVDDVLALTPHAVLDRRSYFGTARATGGAFENVVLTLWLFGADGLLARAEIWEPDRHAEALACFAAVEGSGEATPVEQPFANAATRAWERQVAFWQARDWGRFAEALPATFRLVDRRSMVQLELDREQFVAFVSPEEASGPSRAVSAGIATRGERLALASGHFEVSGADLGPTHIDHLNLIETDTDGAIATLVRFDPGDLEAAYAELDARWAAGEAATHPVASQWLADYRRCFAARDWNAMTGICAPDLVEHDHRLVGWGTLHGPAAIVSSLQAQIELVPDTQERVDHVRCCARAVLLAYAWHGTREGGAFENPWLVLTELDDAGRARRADLWEVEQVDQARTRFDEIAASEPHASRFANAATRALDRGTAALGARDWDGFAALFAAEFRVYDRTPLAQIEADRDQWLAAFREMVEMTSGRPTRQVLATRGDRLAIFRVLWRGAAGDVGPSEVEWLLLIEVDGRGDHLAVVSFDPKDVDAAHAELDARYEAGEGAAYPAHAAFTRAFSQAIASRDWSPVAALCAPTLVEYDHRRLALLGTTRGPEAWVQNVRTLIDLAPDSVRRTDHLRSGARGFCSAGTWHGSRDGGPYELAAIVVVELDERGMVARTDVYDTDQVDDAQARFAELIAPASAATATSDRRPPFARSTMATAAMDRLQAALAAAFAGDDWDAMRALCAPGLVFEDRQRLSRVSGDRELMIASLRERAATGARPEARVIGVVGDRIVLARMLWTGGPADGRFEIEYLSLSEVDASGYIVACILFDPDDARGAQREAWARWAAIDPASAALTTPFGEGIDAFNDHDLVRFRATFADDLVLEDHRHAGLEPEDLDAAVARLAELRPDPLRIPPNAATRAWDRWWDAVVAGDRDAIPAMYDPSYQYQDQRPLFRVDVAGALGTEVLLQEEGWRPARTLLATAGDRLGLQHILWTAGEAGATSEIELLSLDEVGPDGRFVFSAAFDPGDRAAAFTGLRERHLRSTRPAAHRQFLEFQATRHDDLVRFRAVLPDDYFFRDRRRTGLGCLEDADSYVAAVAALNELSSDAVVGQPLYYLADEPHASLSIAHSFGTLADGGQFESVYTMIMVYGRDGLVGVELFELDDLDAAKARFEALRPTPHD